MKTEKKIGEILGQVAVYALAFFVVGINLSLIFDNVAWGDEAFSINTAHNSFSGILEILYYCDNHPPLYYFWLKIFGDLFGHTFVIYHLASLVPFVISIVLVATFFRKRLGNIPVAFLIVILGLGYFCIEYNLEIRMYSLAFLGVLMTFYCAYKVISEGRWPAYIGMILWALVAAYSHYYGLVAVGILMFMTTMAVWIKNRGKSWVKGALSIAIFLACYAPWLYFFFIGLKNVSRSWWMTDILSLKKTASMVLGGHGFNWFILVLLGIASVFLFVAERKQWSDETITVAVGLATITATVGFAYFICYAFKPMLAQRNMYPLSAVTFVSLVVAISRIFTMLRRYRHSEFGNLENIIKTVACALLLLFLGIGIGNFKVHRDVALDEEIKTKATLNLIGEPGDDTMFVTNGVKHLGWTIFPCYFPETEFVNANCYGATKDKFWYFNSTPITDEEQMNLARAGYEVISYGQMQISQYPFFLYYVER